MKIIIITLIVINALFSSIVNEISYDLKGDINNKYKIVMRLNINMSTNEVIGTYWYLSNKNELDIVGEIKRDKKLKMKERFFENGNYKITGYFDGRFKNNAFIGTWHSNDKKTSFPFQLKSYFSHKKRVFDYDIKYEEKGFKTLVDIYVKENNQTIQTIKKSYFNSPRKGKLYSLGLQLIDLNFDGHFDLKIIPCFVGCYDDEYLIYEPKKNRYERLKLPYKGIIDDIDLEEKVIKTSFTDGKSDIYYYYKYINHKFYKIYKKVDVYEFDSSDNQIGGKIIEEYYEIKNAKSQLLNKSEKKYIEADEGRVWIKE